MGAHMTVDDHDQIWDHVEAGESYSSIAKMMGSRLTRSATTTLGTTESDLCRPSLVPRHV